MALTDYELTPTARRVLNIFLMVDCSGSMSGDKIAAVNDAVRNVVPIIESINSDNPDAEIKISALTFGDSIGWTTPNPALAADFEWKDLDASGWTPMGDAVRELNRKLSHKHGFLTSASGSYAPVVIMLSDGAPTDDFSSAITEITANNWFKHAMRIAIAIGSDADIDVLRAFTGNSELVFRVDNVSALKAVIKATVVTSSMVASRSSSVGVVSSATSGAPIAPVTKAAEAAEVLAETLDGTEGLSMGDEAILSSLDFDDFD